MKKLLSSTMMLGLALLMLAGMAWAAQNQAPPPPNVGQEFKEFINISDLPQVVRQALADTAPENSPVSAHKIVRDGKIAFLVTTSGVRGEHVVLVTEDGKVVKQNIRADESTEPKTFEEVKETVNPADLPQAVRQALANTAPDESPVSAQKVNRNGKVGYLVVTSGVRGKHSILIAENGEVLKGEMRAPEQPESKAQALKENIDFSNLPPQVRRGLMDGAPGETYQSAHRVSRGGQLGYAVVMAGARGKHTILITEEGKILKMNMKPDEINNQERPAKKIQKAHDPAIRKTEKAKERVDQKQAAENQDAKKKP